jgi:chromosome segregation ATPase
MKKLPVINLIGVLVLSVLCVVQWRTNRATNLELNRTLQARLKLEEQVAEEKQKAAGANADLDEFRKHVAATEAEAKTIRDELAKLKDEVGALTVERDRLQDGIGQWKKAVAERDEHLKSLANERNDLATKFNELVEKHNVAVKSLNDRTEQFNDLAAKYNDLVKKK